MKPKAWAKSCLTLVRTTNKRIRGVCPQKIKQLNFQFILLLASLDAYL